MNIYLLGLPNVGKSLLFQRLSGKAAKVSNFSGATTGVSSAHGLLTEKSQSIKFVDCPGLYSMVGATQEEQLTWETLNTLSPQENGVFFVIDPHRWQQSFDLGLKLQLWCSARKISFVYVINMMDELESSGIQLDTSKIQSVLGAPVYCVSARTRKGIGELIDFVSTSSDKSPSAQSSLGSTGDKTLSLDEIIKRSHRDTLKVINSMYDGKHSFKGLSILDRWFLSPYVGVPLFFLILIFLFQLMFSWSGPFMDGTEALISWLGAGVSSLLPNGIFKDFVVDALFGGFGSFLVFIPQIFFLMFAISLLEQSGYLTRMALICHRFFLKLGLSGKSIVPFLVGHACAIPAIYSARMMAGKRQKWLTMVLSPLIACSARLPVYTLLIGVMVPGDRSYFYGMLSQRGLVFAGVFSIGYFALILVALVLGLSKKTSQQEPMVMDLPPYRWPLWKESFLKSLKTCWDFVKDAGPIIFVSTVAIWVLSYFPKNELGIEGSYLASLGQWIEPLFAPMGLDWKYGVAILMSFTAREVFVGTLGTIQGVEQMDDEWTNLGQWLIEQDLSSASILALLVFYAIALQCVSTLAIIKAETKSWKLPVVLFVAYTGLAYFLAVATYQVLA